MDPTDLRNRYTELKTEADRLAGNLLDIPRRVVILSHLHLDSGGNHVFPLIAAHGALWALRYFEVGGKVGRFIARRYFYSRTERAYRLSLLQRFAEDFRRVNRQVCVDTFTNYHFTRAYGRCPGADQLVSAPLLEALNRVHHARQTGSALTDGERRQMFEQSFRCEQEVTVAPGVEAAVASFECRFMKLLCLHPLVRFAYFPRWRFLLFRNFADRAERIARGLRAYDHAEQAGWSQVRRCLRHYAVMPERFFEAPAACFAELCAGQGALPSLATA
ncbi:MAG TPA: hypothetical protein VFA18_24515 [Gemmataceae bacterium]|nr:hypothetical protein [Gemmataceae bacterium]